MTTAANDFDIAKSVADLLKGIEKDRQQRVLRWVAESLSLGVSGPTIADLRGPQTMAPTEATASQHLDTHSPRHTRPPDIKTFVDSKAPKSDVQFAAVVAYFFRFEAPLEIRKESIDAQALQEAARLAGRRRSPKPLATLNNAKNLGYLDSPERGQFCINSVGENLVAMTLPGGQTDRPRDNGRSRKKTVKAKTKTRPKKR